LWQNDCILRYSGVIPLIPVIPVFVCTAFQLTIHDQCFQQRAAYDTRTRLVKAATHTGELVGNYTVSQKRAQLWNGIARNYMDRFWWYLAEIFKSL